MHEGYVARIRAQDGGNRRPRLGPPLERILVEVVVGPTRAQFPGFGLGHRPCRLPGEWPGRARVEVDARGSGRERFPDLGDLLVVGEKRGDHASYHRGS